MSQTNSESRGNLRRPLPVTIVKGMPIVSMSADSAGTIVGITQAFCVYRLAESDTLLVANWRDLALGNICPAAPLLPSAITENDRRNASATVLRELLALKQFGLTQTQAATHDDLITYLCGVHNKGRAIRST